MGIPVNDKSKTFWFQDSAQYEKTLATLGISEEEYLNIIDAVLQIFPKDWVDSELADIDKKSNFVHLGIPGGIPGTPYLFPD